MRVYPYHPETKELLGYQDLDASDLDPLSPGQYLIPGSATTVEPPLPSPGFRVVWAGNGWQLQEIPGPPPEPDPEPPTPQPDWGLFRSSLLTSPAYLRIAAHSPTTQVLNANLGQVLWRLEQQPSLFPEAKVLWDAIASEAAPTSEEIAALNTVGETSLVPLRLDSQGFLTLAP